MYNEYIVAHNSYNTEVKIQVHSIIHNMSKQLMTNQCNMKQYERK